MATFNCNWLSPLFEQYLEFEPWDQHKTYPQGTGFYLNCLNAPRVNYPQTFDPQTADQFDPRQLAEQGFKVIIDNLAEPNPGAIEHAHVVSTPAWFWYNESLWYRYLGYDSYQPQRCPRYQALMPINLIRPHRDDFVQALGDLKNNMMWSYVQNGRQLPRDGDMTIGDTQRRFNPEWYDECYISMVVETYERVISEHTPTFITEKTMKPMAFQHPFVVYGNSHTLQTLHSWGFETFDNLWDESYDLLLNDEQRRDAIVQLLQQIKITSHDAETLRRLQHNRDHFYNKDLVISRIRKEIIEPILSYAETR